MSSLFPQAKQTAVDRALMAAFGTAELDSAAPIGGGLSGAGTWRIRVGGIAYVLRIDSPLNAFGDPARAYACMQIAAAAFLAPRIRYASVEDRITISDFVPPRSLALDYPGAGRELIVELAQTVRVLHEQPPFPALVDYLDGMEALIGEFQRLEILDPAATEELLNRFAGLRAVYRTRPSDLVASHNDLNPGNIVYDGERLWLVDWEAAFLADRYVDLATLANWFGRDLEGEAALLRSYFGRAPHAEEQARFEVMQPVNHLFTGLVFLIGTAAERPGVRLDDPTLAGPDLADLRRRLRIGEFAILEWENRAIYGKARLAAALDGMRSSGFADALALVAASP